MRRAFAHLFAGLHQVARFKRLAMLFYVANVAAALILALPISALISERLTHSLESDRLFTALDLGWIAETFYHYQGGPATTLAASFTAVAVCFLILNAFLSGGAIAVFHREDDTFFSACARYFPRMLRLLIIALIFYVAVAGINASVGAAIRMARENSMVAQPWIILGWARGLFVLLLFGAVNMIFDYAKIACVTGNRRSVLRSFAEGMMFVLRKRGATFFIYWTCTIIGLLLLLAYHAISEVVGQASPVAVVLLLIVRQLYTLLRMWVRLWTWASEMAFYTDQTLSSTIVAPEPPSLAAAG